MTVIGTNTAALRAANASSGANSALATSMERLSTGKRINSAKDDAAGLAIATSMTSQIRGMSQGIRNANDGISLAQTAEGSLNEVNNILQRMRELSIQSSTDTMTTTERSYTDKEFGQLMNEITRISNSASYNGMTLLDGQSGSFGASSRASASGVLPWASATHARASALVNSPIGLPLTALKCSSAEA